MPISQRLRVCAGYVRPGAHVCDVGCDHGYLAIHLARCGAASVLAKVSRDRYMLELDRQYPQYQLAKHKGYPTKLHYELIAQYGIQPFYRRSFLKKQGYWPEGK